MNTANITVIGKRVNFWRWTRLANSLHNFIQERRKIYWSIEKTVGLIPFIIICMLEKLSVKYEEYQYYHWNICFISFFPWLCFKKTSSGSKCNGFLCFFLFPYLHSLKAKYQSLVIYNIIRVVRKNKQLAWTSILEAMMMLKKAWGEMTEQKIWNCFQKSGITFQKAQEGPMDDHNDPFKGKVDDGENSSAVDESEFEVN